MWLIVRASSSEKRDPSSVAVLCNGEKTLSYERFAAEKDQPPVNLFCNLNMYCLMSP